MYKYINNKLTLNVYKKRTKLLYFIEICIIKTCKEYHYKLFKFKIILQFTYMFCKFVFKELIWDEISCPLDCVCVVGTMFEVLFSFGCMGLVFELLPIIFLKGNLFFDLKIITYILVKTNIMLIEINNI